MSALDITLLFIAMTAFVAGILGVGIGVAVHSYERQRHGHP